MRKNEHGLQVIDGGSVERSSSNNSISKMRLVPDIAPPPAIQLGIPGLGRSRRNLVSVGLDGLEVHDVDALMQDEGVRHVVDIRLSPTFRGPVGVAMQKAISASLVSYSHLSGLSDPFVGVLAPAWERRDRYLQHLLKVVDQLNVVMKLIHDGPVLLLSWIPRHRESDRAVVIEALQTIDPGFTLRIVD